MTQTSNPERVVQTRRIDLEASFADVPRHFAADGDLIGSHLTATLSAVFPDGEDFFVRCVRRFRDQVTDPALKRQVAGFIGQEAVHGREHRAFNDRLDALGYPTKRIERIVKGALALRERVLSDASNLALTAALEHFTATLAELVLTSAETRAEFGHQAVADLFVWHALEESEHKAVAFDVYRAVGGGERLRRFTMNFLCIFFISFLAVTVTLSLLGDRDTYRPGALRRSWRVLRASPLLATDLWRQLRDYNRSDFHPDDRDTSELVARWRAELFGAEGSLTPKLATSATSPA
ncbi:MAG: metal-dependent hydrolase [Acidimicrobiales bacterium]